MFVSLVCRNAKCRYHIFVSRQRERCAPHPSSLNFRQGNVAISVFEGCRLLGYIPASGTQQLLAAIAAKEFAANHGWLLFHDKLKTSQVYLHDTTLVGADWWTLVVCHRELKRVETNQIQLEPFGSLFMVSLFFRVCCSHALTAGHQAPCRSCCLVASWRSCPRCSLWIPSFLDVYQFASLCGGWIDIRWSNGGYPQRWCWCW